MIKTMKLETLSIDHIYAWMQHFQLKETGKFIGNCNSQTCNRPMFCGQKHCVKLSKHMGKGKLVREYHKFAICQ
jgi:hypothetical protein